MHRFKEFLTEKVIHFFDLDETLFTHGNRTKVSVVKGDKVVRKLTNTEYHDHKLNRGEKYDFTQFRSAKHFERSARPIPHIISRLNRLTKHSKVEIMTARTDFDDKDHFGKVLGKHGIDFHKIHVRRAGNIRGGTVPEKKVRHIEKLIKTHGYKEVHLYDDSEANLKAFKELKHKYPDVQFHAHHVRHSNGKARIVKHK